MNEPNKTYSSFIKRFNSFRFLTDFAFIYAVYILLFRLKGLSTFEISLLLALWCGFALIFEVPTGMLADRCCRAHILSTGMFAKVLAFVVWTFAEGFWMFAIGFLLWAVQETLCSGTMEAFLYDTLKAHGQEADYDRVAGRGHFWSRIGAAISIFFGAVIASWNMDAVAPLSAGVMVVAFVVTLGFSEPGRIQSTSTRLSYRDLLTEAIKEGVHHRILLRLFIYSAVVLAVVGSLDEYEQLYFHHVGLPVALFGVSTVLRMGFEALGSRYSFRFRRRLGSDNVLGVMPLISGIILSISIIFPSIGMIPVFVFLFFFGAVAEVIVESDIQDTVGSEKRATFLSIYSLMINGGALVLILIFGVMAKIGGLFLGFGMFAFMLIAYSLILIINQKAVTKNPRFVDHL